MEGTRGSVGGGVASGAGMFVFPRIFRHPDGIRIPGTIVDPELAFQR